MSGGLNGGAPLNDLRTMTNLTRQEQMILSERAREQGLNARASALNFAVAVVGPTGETAKVLEAARDFAAFLMDDTAAPEGPRQ